VQNKDIYFDKFYLSPSSEKLDFFTKFNNNSADAWFSDTAL